MYRQQQSEIEKEFAILEGISNGAPPGEAKEKKGRWGALKKVIPRSGTNTVNTNTEGTEVLEAAEVGAGK